MPTEPPESAEEAKPSAPQTASPGRSLIYLACVTIVGIVGISSMMPLLPALAKRFDVSSHMISLTLICFTLPGIVCTPLCGILADRIGRKQVLVTSLFIFGISGTACVLADSFQVFLALRFCQGIGSAALSLLNMTVVSDIYPDNRSRMKALAILAGVLSVTSAATPVVAGILGEISIDLVMLLPALGIVLAIVIWKTMPIKSTPSTTQSMRDYLLETIGTAANKDILIVLILTFGTFSLLFGAVSSFVPILLNSRFDASPSTIGLVFSIASAGTLTGTVWITRNLSRLVPGTLLLFGFSIFTFALFLLPLLPAIGLVLIPMFCFGLGQGLNAPMLNTIMLSHAPAKNRGGLLAVQATTMRFAQTMGPSMFSMFYMAFGLTVLFEIGAFIALTLVGLIYLYAPQEKQKS